MKSLFKFGTEHYLPELNVDWFLNVPSIAYREFDGVRMRHTKNGWEFPASLEWVIGEDGQMWEWAPVYPSGGLWNMIRGKQVPSPFHLVDQFENAKSPYTNEYELGEYILTPTPELIPHHAEQLSNINDLNLYDRSSAEEVYSDLRHAAYPLRDNIYGILFVSAEGTAKVDLKLFDWSEYDT